MSEQNKKPTENQKNKNFNVSALMAVVGWNVTFAWSVAAFCHYFPEVWWKLPGVVTIVVLCVILWVIIGSILFSWFNKLDSK